MQTITSGSLFQQALVNLGIAEAKLGELLPGLPGKKHFAGVTQKSGKWLAVCEGNGKEFIIASGDLEFCFAYDPHSTAHARRTKLWMEQSVALGLPPDMPSKLVSASGDTFKVSGLTHYKGDLVVCLVDKKGRLKPSKVDGLKSALAAGAGVKPAAAVNPVEWLYVCFDCGERLWVPYQRALAIWHDVDPGFCRYCGGELEPATPEHFRGRALARGLASGQIDAAGRLYDPGAPAGHRRSRATPRARPTNIGKAGYAKDKRYFFALSVAVHKALNAVGIRASAVMRADAPDCEDEIDLGFGLIVVGASYDQPEVEQVAVLFTKDRKRVAEVYAQSVAGIKLEAARIAEGACDLKRRQSSKTA